MSFLQKIMGKNKKDRSKARKMEGLKGAAALASSLATPSAPEVATTPQVAAQAKPPPKIPEAQVSVTAVAPTTTSAAPPPKLKGKKSRAQSAASTSSQVNDDMSSQSPKEPNQALAASLVQDGLTVKHKVENQETVSLNPPTIISESSCNAPTEIPETSSSLNKSKVILPIQISAFETASSNSEGEKGVGHTDFSQKSKEVPVVTENKSGRVSKPTQQSKVSQQGKEEKPKDVQVADKPTPESRELPKSSTNATQTAAGIRLDTKNVEVAHVTKSSTNVSSWLHDKLLLETQVVAMSLEAALQGPSPREALKTQAGGSNAQDDSLGEVSVICVSKAIEHKEESNVSYPKEGIPPQKSAACYGMIKAEKPADTAEDRNSSSLGPIIVRTIEESEPLDKSKQRSPGCATTSKRLSETLWTALETFEQQINQDKTSQEMLASISKQKEIQEEDHKTRREQTDNVEPASAPTTTIQLIPEVDEVRAINTEKQLQEPLGTGVIEHEHKNKSYQVSVDPGFEAKASDMHDEPKNKGNKTQLEGEGNQTTSQANIANAQEVASSFKENDHKTLNDDCGPEVAIAAVEEQHEYQRINLLQVPEDHIIQETLSRELNEQQDVLEEHKFANVVIHSHHELLQEEQTLNILRESLQKELQKDKDERPEEEIIEQANFAEELKSESNTAAADETKNESLKSEQKVNCNGIGENTSKKPCEKESESAIPTEATADKTHTENLMSERQVSLSDIDEIISRSPCQLERAVENVIPTEATLSTISNIIQEQTSTRVLQLKDDLQEILPTNVCPLRDDKFQELDTPKSLEVGLQEPREVTTLLSTDKDKPEAQWTVTEAPTIAEEPHKSLDGESGYRKELLVTDEAIGQQECNSQAPPHSVIQDSLSIKVDEHMAKDDLEPDGVATIPQHQHNGTPQLGIIDESVQEGVAQEPQAADLEPTPWTSRLHSEQGQAPIHQEQTSHAVDAQNLDLENLDNTDRKTVIDEGRNGGKELHLPTNQTGTTFGGQETMPVGPAAIVGEDHHKEIENNPPSLDAAEREYEVQEAILRNPSIQQTSREIQLEELTKSLMKQASVPKDDDERLEDAQVSRHLQYKTWEDNSLEKDLTQEPKHRNLQDEPCTEAVQISDTQAVISTTAANTANDGTVQENEEYPTIEIGRASPNTDTPEQVIIDMDVQKVEVATLPLQILRVDDMQGPEVAHVSQDAEQEALTEEQDSTEKLTGESGSFQLATDAESKISTEVAITEQEHASLYIAEDDLQKREVTGVALDKKQENQGDESEQNHADSMIQEPAINDVSVQIGIDRELELTDITQHPKEAGQEMEASFLSMLEGQHNEEAKDLEEISFGTDEQREALCEHGVAEIQIGVVNEHSSEEQELQMKDAAVEKEPTSDRIEITQTSQDIHINEEIDEHREAIVEPGVAGDVKEYKSEEQVLQTADAAVEKEAASGRIEITEAPKDTDIKEEILFKADEQREAICEPDVAEVQIADVSMNQLQVEMDGSQQPDDGLECGKNTSALNNNKPLSQTNKQEVGIEELDETDVQDEPDTKIAVDDQETNVCELKVPNNQESDTPANADIFEQDDHSDPDIHQLQHINDEPKLTEQKQECRDLNTDQFIGSDIQERAIDEQINDIQKLEGTIPHLDEGEIFDIIDKSNENAQKNEVCEQETEQEKPTYDLEQIENRTSPTQPSLVQDEESNIGELKDDTAAVETVTESSPLLTEISSSIGEITSGTKKYVPEDSEIEEQPSPSVEENTNEMKEIEVVPEADEQRDQNKNVQEVEVTNVLFPSVAEGQGVDFRSLSIQEQRATQRSDESVSTEQITKELQCAQILTLPAEQNQTSSALDAHDNELQIAEETNEQDENPEANYTGQEQASSNRSIKLENVELVDKQVESDKTIDADNERIEVWKPEAPDVSSYLDLEGQELNATNLSKQENCEETKFKEQWNEESQGNQSTIPPTEEERASGVVEIQNNELEEVQATKARVDYSQTNSEEEQKNEDPDMEADSICNRSLLAEESDHEKHAKEQVCTEEIQTSQSVGECNDQVQEPEELNEAAMQNKTLDEHEETETEEKQSVQQPECKQNTIAVNEESSSMEKENEEVQAGAQHTGSLKASQNEAECEASAIELEGNSANRAIDILSEDDASLKTSKKSTEETICVKSEDAAIDVEECPKSIEETICVKAKDAVTDVEECQDEANETNPTHGTVENKQECQEKEPDQAITGHEQATNKIEQQSCMQKAEAISQQQEENLQSIDQTTLLTQEEEQKNEMQECKELTFEQEQRIDVVDINAPIADGVNPLRMDDREIESGELMSHKVDEQQDAIEELELNKNQTETLCESSFPAEKVFCTTPTKADDNAQTEAATVADEVHTCAQPTLETSHGSGEILIETHDRAPVEVPSYTQEAVAEELHTCDQPALETSHGSGEILIETHDRAPVEVPSYAQGAHTSQEVKINNLASSGTESVSKESFLEEHEDERLEATGESVDAEMEKGEQQEHQIAIDLLRSQQQVQGCEEVNVNEQEANVQHLEVNPPQAESIAEFSQIEDEATFDTLTNEAERGPEDEHLASNKDQDATQEPNDKKETTQQNQESNEVPSDEVFTEPRVDDQVITLNEARDSVQESETTGDLLEVDKEGFKDAQEPNDKEEATEQNQGGYEVPSDEVFTEPKVEEQVTTLNEETDGTQESEITGAPPEADKDGLRDATHEPTDKEEATEKNQERKEVPSDEVFTETKVEEQVTTLNKEKDGTQESEIRGASLEVDKDGFKDATQEPNDKEEAPEQNQGGDEVPSDDVFTKPKVDEQVTTLNEERDGKQESEITGAPLEADKEGFKQATQELSDKDKATEQNQGGDEVPSDEADKDATHEPNDKEEATEQIQGGKPKVEEQVITLYEERDCTQGSEIAGAPLEADKDGFTQEPNDKEEATEKNRGVEVPSDEIFTEPKVEEQVTALNKERDGTRESEMTGAPVETDKDGFKDATHELDDKEEAAEKNGGAEVPSNEVFTEHKVEEQVTALNEERDDTQESEITGAPFETEKDGFKDTTHKLDDKEEAVEQNQEMDEVLSDEVFTEPKVEKQVTTLTEERENTKETEITDEEVNVNGQEEKFQHLEINPDQAESSTEDETTFDTLTNEAERSRVLIKTIIPPEEEHLTFDKDGYKDATQEPNHKEEATEQNQERDEVPSDELFTGPKVEEQVTTLNEERDGMQETEITGALLEADKERQEKDVSVPEAERASKTGKIGETCPELSGNQEEKNVSTGDTYMSKQLVEDNNFEKKEEALKAVTDAVEVKEENHEEETREDLIAPKHQEQTLVEVTEGIEVIDVSIAAEGRAAFESQLKAYPSESESDQLATTDEDCLSKDAEECKRSTLEEHSGRQEEEDFSLSSLSEDSSSANSIKDQTVLAEESAVATSTDRQLDSDIGEPHAKGVALEKENGCQEEKCDQVQVNIGPVHEEDTSIVVGKHQEDIEELEVVNESFNVEDDMHKLEVANIELEKTNETHQLEPAESDEEGIERDDTEELKGQEEKTDSVEVDTERDDIATKDGTEELKEAEEILKLEATNSIEVDKDTEKGDDIKKLEGPEKTLQVEEANSIGVDKESRDGSKELEGAEEALKLEATDSIEVDIERDGIDDLQGPEKTLQLEATGSIEVDIERDDTEKKDGTEELNRAEEAIKVASIDVDIERDATEELKTTEKTPELEATNSLEVDRERDDTKKSDGTEKLKEAEETLKLETTESIAKGIERENTDESDDMEELKGQEKTLQLEAADSIEVNIKRDVKEEVVLITQLETVTDTPLDDDKQSNESQDLKPQNVEPEQKGPELKCEQTHNKPADEEVSSANVGSETENEQQLQVTNQSPDITSGMPKLEVRDFSVEVTENKDTEQELNKTDEWTDAKTSQEIEFEQNNTVVEEAAPSIEGDNQKYDVQELEKATTYGHEIVRADNLSNTIIEQSQVLIYNQIETPKSREAVPTIEDDQIAAEKEQEMQLAELSQESQEIESEQDLITIKSQQKVEGSEHEQNPGEQQNLELRDVPLTLGQGKLEIESEQAFGHRCDLACEQPVTALESEEVPAPSTREKEHSADVQKESQELKAEGIRTGTDVQSDELQKFRLTNIAPTTELQKQESSLVDEGQGPEDIDSTELYTKVPCPEDGTEAVLDIKQYKNEAEEQHNPADSVVQQQESTIKDEEKDGVQGLALTTNEHPDCTVLFADKDVQNHQAQEPNDETSLREIQSGQKLACQEITPLPVHEEQPNIHAPIAEQKDTVQMHNEAVEDEPQQSYATESENGNEASILLTVEQQEAIAVTGAESEIDTRVASILLTVEQQESTSVTEGKSVIDTRVTSILLAVEQQESTAGIDTSAASILLTVEQQESTAVTEAESEIQFLQEAVAAFEGPKDETPKLEEPAMTTLEAFIVGNEASRVVHQEEQMQNSKVPDAGPNEQNVMLVAIKVDDVAIEPPPSTYIDKQEKELEELTVHIIQAENSSHLDEKMYHSPDQMPAVKIPEEMPKAPREDPAPLIIIEDEAELHVQNTTTESQQECFKMESTQLSADNVMCPDRQKDGVDTIEQELEVKPGDSSKDKEQSTNEADQQQNEVDKAFKSMQQERESESVPTTCLYQKQPTNEANDVLEPDAAGRKIATIQSTIVEQENLEKAGNKLLADEQHRLEATKTS